MLEKYGVDMSELPVSDDQLRQLKAFKKQGAAFEPPKNRAEAEVLLEKLAQEGT